MVNQVSTSNCSTDVTDDNDSSSDVVTIEDVSESEENGQELVLAPSSNKNASFRDIEITNSNNVHVGDNTYYKGPVTIKQYMYANSQISNGDLSEHGDEKLAIKNGGIDVIPSISYNLYNKDSSGFLDKLNEIPDRDKKIIAPNAQHTQIKRGTQWIQNFPRQHWVLIVSLVALLLVCLITLLSVFLTKDQSSSNTNPQHPIDTNEQQSGSPSEYPIDPSVGFTLPDKLRMVTRREWLAQPPVSDPVPLKLPVPYVIILETEQDNCTDQAACTFHVRYKQSYDIDSRNRSDISYNFLVGGDGNAYEGRGWKSEGAHTFGYNARSIGIAFVGTFTRFHPPERQIIAAKQLIRQGLELGYLAKNFKLLGNRQLEISKNPGTLLLENIKKWPHWSDKAVENTDPKAYESITMQNFHRKEYNINITDDFIPRSGWEALPPNDTLTKLNLPVPYVIIMHTAQENCTKLQECILTVQVAQSFHMYSRGWDDIGYNFLVGGDNHVYEGRGWLYVGAHTYGYNSRSIGIAFIGTFNAYMPTKKQIELTKKLIEKGVELGYIDKNYKLLAARQLQATQSPGLLLYEDVKTWPHWAEKP